MVVDNYGIDLSKAVQKCLLEHPRFELLLLPTYCPKANPIERVFWEVHDKCTRNHMRKRLQTLVRDVERHSVRNGAWKYEMSTIYLQPEATAAMANIGAETPEKVAA